MAEVIQLKGFTELAAALRELPQLVARKALRSATNAGASVIKKSAANRVRQKTGLTKKNLYQKQIREASGPMVQTFYVGVRTGKKRNRDGSFAELPFYWRFLEFGTSKLPPAPFLRPAFEAEKDAAIKAIGEKLDERIQKFALELSKK